jgi:hypothetical protein
VPKPVEVSDYALKRAQALIDNHSDIRQFRRGILTVLLADNRYTAEELAGLFHISRGSVFEEVAKVRDPDFQPKGQWGGARNNILKY